MALWWFFDPNAFLSTIPESGPEYCRVVGNTVENFTTICLLGAINMFESDENRFQDLRWRREEPWHAPKSVYTFSYHNKLRLLVPSQNRCLKVPAGGWYRRIVLSHWIHSNVGISSSLHPFGVYLDRSKILEFGPRTFGIELIRTFFWAPGLLDLRVRKFIFIIRPKPFKIEYCWD